MASEEDFRPGERAGAEADEPTERDLTRELRAIRPRPSESFRRELDGRAAAGFPPRRRDHAGREAGAEGSQGRPPSLRERLRLPAALRLGPALAGAAVVCAVATAVVVSEPNQLGLGGDQGGGGNSASLATMEAATMQTRGGTATADQAQAPGGPAASVEATRQSAASAVTDSQQYGVAQKAKPEARLEAFNVTGPRGGGNAIAADRDRRAVERDASLTLATEPSEIDDVAADVLRVVASHDGIVMSSTTRGGLEGEAGAEFALKIPSAGLSGALAELSELATVRHRSESSLDITAPTVTIGDRLSEARAKVRGLLKQLAEATTDSEREIIEIDLAPAQRRVARLRSQLDRLERRANFADVSVAIVTGEAGAMPEEEEWTLSEAADDALRVLTVVGGVLLIAAAIVVPIGLLAIICWAIGRLWLRRARERALRRESA